MNRRDIAEDDGAESGAHRFSAVGSSHHLGHTPRLWIEKCSVAAGRNESGKLKW